MERGVKEDDKSKHVSEAPLRHSKHLVSDPTLKHTH
jgi:hypothetical protein